MLTTMPKYYDITLKVTNCLGRFSEVGRDCDQRQNYVILQFSDDPIPHMQLNILLGHVMKDGHFSGK